jgi:hypothetical protein
MGAAIHFGGGPAQEIRRNRLTQYDPKSSPNVATAKKSAPGFWRASQFSARRLKIHALSASNHRNALI